MVTRPCSWGCAAVAFSRAAAREHDAHPPPVLVSGAGPR